MFHRSSSSTRRRAIVTLSATAALVATLAACSGGSTAGTGASSGDSGTVNWWGWTPDDGEANALIAAFNQEYPQIKVVYKKLQDASYNAALRPALASSSGPDVYDVAAGGATGDVATFGGSAVDLSVAMQKAHGASWKDDIYAAGLTDFTQDGKLKAAPVGQIASGFLWINQQIFDRYGVKPPTTLKEWVNACATFRANGLGCLAEGIGQPGFDIDTLHSIADSIQPGDFAKAADGTIPWTSPTIVKAFGLFKQLATDGILDEGAVGIQQYPDVNNAFLSGKVPMVQMGTWYQQYATKKALGAALEAAGVPSGTGLVTIVPIPFPDVAGNSNTPNLFGDPDYALAVSSRSKVVDAATTFALWVSSNKTGQQIIADHLTDYPAMTSVAVDWSSLDLVDPASQVPALQNLAKRVAQVDQSRQAKLPAQMIQALVTADQSVIGGQQTPEEAASSVQAAAVAKG